MPERAPPLALDGGSLDALAAAVAARPPAPVESWDPPYCGDSGIRIDAEGRWLHDGTAIPRPAMIRLFASVLRREPDGRYLLVTPVEKLGIAVDDLPFVATALRTEGEGSHRRIAFSLGTGEIVFAGPLRAIVAADERGRPALALDRGLAARIARPVWYELAELAIGEGGDPPGLWADGAFFPLAAG